MSISLAEPFRQESAFFELHKDITSATESISPDEQEAYLRVPVHSQGQVLRLLETIALARVLSSNRISWFGCE